MTLVDIRDIAIIVLAALSIIVGILLVILILMIIGLTVMLRKRMGPILEMTKGTLSNLQGTTIFVSDTVVKPIIKAASFAAGARRTIGILTRLSRRKGGR